MTLLVSCSNCKKAIPANASRCPHCGHDYAGPHFAVPCMICLTTGLTRGEFHVEACEACGGVGYTFSAQKPDCPSCAGHGWRLSKQTYRYGFMWLHVLEQDIKETCSLCGGSGYKKWAEVG